MLMWNGYVSCVLLLVHGTRCSDLQQDPTGVSEELSKQLPAETDTSYEFNHPPLPEINEQKTSRKEKSLNINETNSSPIGRTRSRNIRRKARPRAGTPSLEIPVQVIYETEATTLSSYTSTSKSTVSPSDKNTRVFVRERHLKSNTNKNIDIRQATTGKTDTDTIKNENAQVFMDNEKTKEFPKRSRESYFKKRTESPEPRVKIVEEKNFVYAHSGNFHYSFLGGDGTKVSSQGSLKSYDNNKTGEAVSGSVFYKGMDGNDYSLTYTADENGYRPVGAHLPTPPPLPPAIARALKYIADKSTPAPAENE